MKKWLQKAIVQKLISYFPLSHKINYIFQKYVTRGVHLDDEYFYDRLLHAKEHLKAYQKYSGKNIPEKSLEIGTGWYPIVPVAFFLSGVDNVYSVDIRFLTSTDRMQTTLKKFVDCYKVGKLKEYINSLPERYETIMKIVDNPKDYTLNTILELLNIKYLVEDARKLSLPDNSIDLVNSNNTFEHIYPEILIPILMEFKRVTKKNDGVMSHFIDMTDHFAHFDKSITIYNFLRFTDRQWRWIDNTIQPQSRARIYNYRNIFGGIGISITEEHVRKGNQDELSTVPLSEKFSKESMDQVAISHCHFITDMKMAKI
jgi:hypothetical protein